MQTSQEKTSAEYWTTFWNNYTLPKPIQINTRTLSSYVYRIYDQHFKKAFAGQETRGKKILELGCGNSVFLSYFNQEFGFEVYGIDYTEIGCEQTRAILDRDRVKGTIILGDIFNPPADLLNSFDVVCSFGVAEHFDDTSAALSAFSKFLKPDGILITTIPNMAGATGWLQKVMYKEVYDVHRIMSANKFSEQFKNTPLKLISCEYFVPISFGLTLDPIGKGKISYRKIKKLFIKSLQAISKIFWVVDDRAIRLPNTTLLSGSIFSVAKFK